MSMLFTCLSVLLILGGPEVEQTEHPAFDLSAWSDELDSFYESKNTDISYFGAIHGPLSVANIERHRTKLSNILDDQRSVPVDVFVWSVGQPEKPYHTKTGGVPYWPRNREWPTSGKGEPLSFFSQFCMQDSQDLVDGLPGDVLLLFTDSDFDSLEVRWVQVEEDQAVWTDDDEIPSEPGFEIPEFFGNVFRTRDYPDLENIRPNSITDVNKRYDTGQLFVHRAYKIGGTPSLVQDFIMEKNERLICQFSSITAIRGYSFVNMKDTGNPKDNPFSYAEGFCLPIGDDGVISVLQNLDDLNEFRVVGETH